MWQSLHLPMQKKKVHSLIHMPNRHYVIIQFFSKRVKLLINILITHQLTHSQNPLCALSASHILAGTGSSFVVAYFHFSFC